MARRRRRRDRLQQNAEINVVSLIDVMMLLMIIFMITAPMMQGGVDIALPKAQTRPLESKGGLVITVNKAREIRVGDVAVSLSEFRSTFAALAKNRAQGGVYLRADSGVDYGLIVQLMAIMNAAGVSQIGLVTEPEEIK